MRLSFSTLLTSTLLVLTPALLAEPAPNPNPTGAPDANLIPLAERQVSGSLPGLSGSAGPSGVCGTVGPISGCAGPSGASGSIPGLSGSAGQSGVTWTIGGGTASTKSTGLGTSTATAVGSSSGAGALRTGGVLGAIGVFAVLLL